jgi:hypothetical protein
MTTGVFGAFCVRCEAEAAAAEMAMETCLEADIVLLCFGWTL